MDVEQRIWVGAQRGVGRRALDAVVFDRACNEQVCPIGQCRAAADRGHEIRPLDADRCGHADHAAIAAGTRAGTDSEAGDIAIYLMHQWVETAHALSIHKRSECVEDFAAILPFIHALRGETTVRSLGRTIVSVGVWWR